MKTKQAIFLQLYDKIDSAESKNKDVSQGLIYSYFDFEETVFKRYKELKLEHDKDESQVLVKSRAPNGSGRIGSTALPDPKLRVGSGNGSERVRWVLNLTNQ